jgi:hypothetical protein
LLGGSVGSTACDARASARKAIDHITLPSG